MSFVAPESNSTWLYLLLAVIVFVPIYALKLAKNRGKLPLPPGPPGKWPFGTRVPVAYSFLTFYEWTKQYGPVFSFKQGMNTVVIIGGFAEAMEIMEKEGASLVDRPRSIAAGETLSGGMRVVLMNGEKVKKFRKALHSHLQPKVAATYEPLQLLSSQNYVLDILKRPEAHQDHAKKYAASVVLTLAYGKTTPTSYSDPEVQRINECLSRLGDALRPGAYRVDTIPLLRYVPGYLDKLREAHRLELALFSEQLGGVLKKMTTGDFVPSFTSYLVENQSEIQLSDNELAYLSGSIFGAGSETTASGLSFMIMAAACHPEAQTQVQNQLDQIVGKDRHPVFSDEELLSQVTAFYIECGRWRPISAGGFPHQATRDIHWRGYCIPKGATVIGNHWAIGRSPDAFPDGDTFDPQRWLTPHGTIRNDLKQFTFGFGRRVCPGLHVANRSLFITTALILWAFKITPDPSKPIDTMAFTPTANVHPLPFSVRFEPRIPPEEIVRIFESGRH
ncbi:cytochrome P450 [Pluteus cervinus]|uniref:Cytochrome P450 n=1 Tax=Pluteus cervinus TaxID=181527 RepID=A0ACD3ARX4_9AGAR|nr:cytochrome P450 [Pluteus cervinus]